MSIHQVRLASIEDCPALGRILVSATESSFKGLVPHKCLEWTPEQSATNWKRNFKEDGTLAEGSCIYVAESDREGVVGFAMWGETRPNEAVTPPIDSMYANELRILHVAPDWQRRGVGRLLVSHVAADLWHKGITHMLVRVLTINPNLAFYERLGAVKLGVEPHDWDGFETEQSVYGWDDTSKLIVKEGTDG